VHVIFLQLLLHNLSVALMIVGAGLWLRGLPGIVIGVNGFVVGYVAAVVAALAGISIFAVVLKLIPHGIFELPALVGSGWLALRVNRWKRVGPEEKVQAEDVRWVARCIGWIVVLLVIAAAVEALRIGALSPPRIGGS
jgi:stage II sporulation protein M